MRLGADVLILDDGYQCLQRRSSLRLALIDKSNPFGNHSLLPRGLLREPLEYLDQASCILLTKPDGREDRALEEKIRRVNCRAQIVECCHKPRYFVEHRTGEVRPLEVLRGGKGAIFCAIASPEGFGRFILSLGAHIIYKKGYIDHHRFTQSELRKQNSSLCSKASGTLTTQLTKKLQQNTPLKLAEKGAAQSHLCVEVTDFRRENFAYDAADTSNVLSINFRVAADCTLTGQDGHRILDQQRVEAAMKCQEAGGFSHVAGPGNSATQGAPRQANLRASGYYLVYRRVKMDQIVPAAKASNLQDKSSVNRVF
jgi:hypothetical protein